MRNYNPTNLALPELEDPVAAALRAHIARREAATARASYLRSLASDEILKPAKGGLENLELADLRLIDSL